MFTGSLSQRRYRKVKVKRAKSILGFVGQIVLLTVMALAVVVLLGCLAPLQPLAGQPATPDDTPLLASAYPPPDVTQEATPALDQTTESPSATVTLQPTVNPLTPVPPDFWPMDQPWPPLTATVELPQPTPGVTLFPAPDFKMLATGVPESELQTFWYPASPGYNAKVSLEEILIDGNGKRQEKAKSKIDLKLMTFPSISQILGLFIPQEGSVAAIIKTTGEGATTEIVDLSTGETINFKNQKITITNFYSWSTDGKFFIAGINDDPASVASVVDAKTGESRKIIFGDHDGVPAEIKDMAYSINGSFIADGISYQPWYGKNNPWITEIGIRNTKDLSSRRLICTIENGKSMFPHSLKWSPDGQMLTWIGGLDAPDVNGWDLWLWLADTTTNNCQKIAHLGVNKGGGNFIPGGYSADWSPDSKEIAFRLEAENAGYGLAIYNLELSQLSDIGISSQEIISNVQFSPDGSFIVYSVGKKDYGEIWAISLDGKDKFPIAGPTTLNAPYKWRKNK